MGAQKNGVNSALVSRLWVQREHREFVLDLGHPLSNIRLVKGDFGEWMVFLHHDKVGRFSANDTQTAKRNAQRLVFTWCSRAIRKLLADVT
jgi:hypothetical protein